MDGAVFNSDDRNSAGGLRSRHYDAAQLRSDLWNRLKHLSQTLHDATARNRPLGDTRARLAEVFDLLRPIESYWAFPGKAVIEELARVFERGEFDILARRVARLERLLESDAYRARDVATLRAELEEHPTRSDHDDRFTSGPRSDDRPYFEVLIVDNVSTEEESDLRQRLYAMRRDHDEFVYEVVVVPSFEDALIAALFNYNVQSVVIRYNFPFHSTNKLDLLRRYIELLDREFTTEDAEGDVSLRLASAIRSVRPELDLFWVTDTPVEEVAGNLSEAFRRVFYRQEDYLELHLSILKGIHERYETPFFTALRNYSQKPTGVFHALPISRGKSIAKSHWIRDMGEFYGTNVFLAETSATTGGLDSLLQPHGPLKRAQELAARAFGAKKTFFVTNGTSTANKIVVQAVVRPGDIVLASRDCHKSHHYALILAGAFPVYMDPVPLSEFSMYGAVPMKTIKRHLLDLQAAGNLDRVKMVLLTNCTFDGIVYDPLRVMQEILAIKPDMIFVWDEAWFAFATFTPTYRRRTAMFAAGRLRDRLASSDYRRRYQAWKTAFPPLDAGEKARSAWIEGPLMADPDVVKVRVYVTQSTHKTLTALRQGSMIHIYDQEFEHESAEAFHEAYMTHTSTSPNYQVLASLDVGRRQVELEGYELVQKSIELAMTVRERIHMHPQLKKYFRIVGAKDLIPAEQRPSGIEYYYEAKTGWRRMEEAWRIDEFAIDPTRVTVHIGRTGMDGETFRRELIDKYDIQINKTSRNTVLFMIHIGMTRGTVAYLIEVLTKIARELDERLASHSRVEAQLHEARVASLTRDLPPLPDFSRFHAAFACDADGRTSEGDMRRAFFLAYDESNCEHLRLDGAISRALAAGREVVSASFVTPYPPGFPVLVPGQIISPEILAFLQALDTTEIHGFNPDYGLRVFTESALSQMQSDMGKLSRGGQPSDLIDRERVPISMRLNTVRSAARNE